MRFSSQYLSGIVITIVALGLTGNAEAQVVECSLSRSTPELVTGECRVIPGAHVISIALRRFTRSGSAWAGTMSSEGGTAAVDVTAYVPLSASDSIEVVRTPFGWFVPTTIDLEADPPRLAWDMEREAPPSDADLEIVARARELLAEEPAWGRMDDRRCAPSAAAYSLYCALAQATRAVTGAYQHRQPALQVVRRIVAEHWPARVREHRLMDFNNDDETTHEDVVRALDLSRKRLLEHVR